MHKNSPTLGKVITFKSFCSNHNIRTPKIKKTTKKTAIPMDIKSRVKSGFFKANITSSLIRYAFISSNFLFDRRKKIISAHNDTNHENRFLRVTSNKMPYKV